MKNNLLFCVLFLSASFHLKAQSDMDTTSSVKKYSSGMAIYAEVGVLPNNSFKAIREQLKALNVKPFEPVMASIVLAKRMETEKFFAETRLILMNSTKHGNDNDVRKGIFRGIGIGVDASPKFVNSKHWNVLVPIGWDLMLYQFKVKNNQSASLSQVVQNPNNYQSVKLHNGSFNLHAGLGVDYKMNLFPKFYDKVYISAKGSYHLPVFKMGKWRGDDVKITDLPSFKANQLYAQLGLVFFPKNMPNKMWGRMH